MLILVPPSEGKRPPPDDGEGVRLERLSFPELTPARGRIIDALIETSAGPDAFERLFVRPTLAHEVERNTRLLEVPVRPAAEVYIGPLHEGLDLASLTPHAMDRAERSLLIASALWGALRPSDPIPAYRLRSWANLRGLGRLEPIWRPLLPDLFALLAGTDGLIFDLRPGSFQAFGMPTGRSDRTIAVRVDQFSENGQRIGDVIAKRVRGQAAHQLLEAGEESDQPDVVADILGERWPVRLEAPTRSGRPWTLSLTVAD